MSTPSSRATPTVRNRWLPLVEFGVWVSAATVVTVVVCTILAFLFGTGLVTLKRLLFVVGLMAFGLGAIGFQPRRRARVRSLTTPEMQRDTDETTNVEHDPENKLVSTETGDPLAFEETLQTVPPLADHRVPFEDRIRRDVKVFATGILVLAISALMEYGLGITPA